jgi:zinc/manganese transport system substrate-binding protein
VVVYHESWDYLLNWLEMETLISLERKPGIPLNISHLEKALHEIKEEDILGILVSPYENKKPAQWLSERGNISVLDLPYTVGGNEEAKDLMSLFENSIHLLTKP